MVIFQLKNNPTKTFNPTKNYFLNVDGGISVLVRLFVN